MVCGPAPFWYRALSLSPAHRGPGASRLFLPSPGHSGPLQGPSISKEDTLGQVFPHQVFAKLGFCLGIPPKVAGRAFRLATSRVLKQRSGCSIRSQFLECECWKRKLPDSSPIAVYFTPPELGARNKKLSKQLGEGPCPRLWIGSVKISRENRIFVEVN